MTKEQLALTLMQLLQATRHLSASERKRMFRLYGFEEAK